AGAVCPWARVQPGARARGRRGALPHRLRRRLRHRRALDRLGVRAAQRGPAGALRARRDAAWDADRVLVVLPVHDRAAGPRARLVVAGGRRHGPRGRRRGAPQRRSSRPPRERHASRAAATLHLERRAPYLRARPERPPAPLPRQSIRVPAARRRLLGPPVARLVRRDALRLAVGTRRGGVRAGGIGRYAASIGANIDSVWGLAERALAALGVPDAALVIVVVTTTGVVATYLLHVLPHARRASDPVLSFGLATTVLLFWSRLYS